MKSISSLLPVPNSASVRHLADSVLPTPVGPSSRKLPLGLGPTWFSPSSAACTARASRLVADFWPRIRASRRRGRSISRSKPDCKRDPPYSPDRAKTSVSLLVAAPVWTLGVGLATDWLSSFFSLSFRTATAPVSFRWASSVCSANDCTLPASFSWLSLIARRSLLLSCKPRLASLSSRAVSPGNGSGAYSGRCRPRIGPNKTCPWRLLDRVTQELCCSTR